jgi:hypothetical protein
VNQQALLAHILLASLFVDPNRNVIRLVFNFG